MDKLRRSRRVLRMTSTKTLHELEAELVAELFNLDVLENKLQKLEETVVDLKTLDGRILDLMFDQEATEEDVDEEVLTSQNYHDDARAMINRCKKVMNPVRVEVQMPVLPQMNQSIQSVAAGKSLKLPPVQLKTFNGELMQWLGWWSSFRQVHEDDERDPAVKIQYLSNCMEPGTRAKELVDSYPQTGENYPKVISALKERYGKDELLRELYVRELLKLAMNNVSSKEKKLSKMFDKLESHLRALESLGVTSQESAVFLFPMVESSIPVEVLRAWLRCPLSSRDGSLEEPKKTKMDFLMEFLRNEVNAEERSYIARTGFGNFSRNPERRKQDRCPYEEDVPTAVGLFTAQTQSCIFCEKNNHSSGNCFTVRSLSLIEKKEKIRMRKGCFNCLRPGHFSQQCKTHVKCKNCNKTHPTILCPDQQQSNQKKDEKRNDERSNFSKNYDQTSVVMSNHTCSGDVQLQTLLVKVRGVEGKSCIARLIFDSGSQKTFVLSSTARKLGLRPLEKKWTRKALFGAKVTEPQLHHKFQLRLESVDGKVKRELMALDEEDICGKIRRIPRGSWIEELKRKNIFLSDFESESSEIEVLVGSDYYGRLLTGRIIHLESGLTAAETVFGWTISGSVPKEDSKALLVTSLWMGEANPVDLWDLETLGIKDPSEHRSKEEKDLVTKRHFQRDLTRNDDGRYCVGLPFINGNQIIPNNKAISVKRLKSATQKLISTGKVAAYEEVFNSWEEEGIIEEVKVDEDPEETSCHYLPHRPVFKPESLTTPIRPVFDASCKTKRAPSLNDCLAKGPNLMELIPSILIRFRVGRIGVISDIRKAFLQIDVRREDRNFLRFLWWKDLEKNILKIYRHKRVVFGVNCSPFLLAAVIEHHLGQVKDEDRYVAEKLARSLYVDNCVASVDSVEEMQVFKSDCTRIMAEAQMELRCWEAGRMDEVDDFDKSSPMTSVLGLKWNKDEDSLLCDFKNVELEKVTKRSVLSSLHRIFDPMGFYCPALLLPKLLLQESWSEKSGWDDDMNLDMKTRFQRWYSEATELKYIKIPRNMTGGVSDRKTWQLHMFSDASKEAYAATVFLRTGEAEDVSIQLIQAKTRVAPMKKTSIPRLELLGCTIGSRLAATVKDALKFDGPIFYWSDSTTALAWIRRNDNWGTFVGNRVKEICMLTDVRNWRHVPGPMNPADLPSRGCSPSDLLRTTWWEGPQWMKQSEKTWPHFQEEENEEEILKERKKSAPITAMIVKEVKTPWFMLRFSNFQSCVRVVAWMRRWLPSNKQKGNLILEEMEEAEMNIVKIIQKGAFPKIIDRWDGLRVVRDEKGLIRVKTKLLFRKDMENFRLPLLLPSHHPWVKFMIQCEHEKNGHAGVHFLMSKLREQFWILQGRRTIKSVVGRCVTCRRFSSKSPVTVPVPLPEDRVKDAKAFEVTGIDLAGPLFLRDKSKVWIVLFTCAIFRAVHLELVTSLSTETFLLALQRFVGRRGRPKTIYSDNGLNFVGAANLFSNLDWNAIERECLVEKILWKFNLPSAPWWGGWWERLIRLLKDLLKRMLGHKKLDFEELSTILCEVEAIMNGRPLTYVSEDAEDLIPLTPSMFIQDETETCTPEIEEQTGDSLRKRYRYRQRLQEELRVRFRKEYLSQLVQRGKEKENMEIKVGDVVLVGTENKKRLMWPMAKIVELYPGKDGVIRSARVKTATSELLRPVQRLFSLEVHSSDHPIVHSSMV